MSQGETQPLIGNNNNSYHDIDDDTRLVVYTSRDDDPMDRDNDLNNISNTSIYNTGYNTNNNENDDDQITNTNDDGSAARETITEVFSTTSGCIRWFRIMYNLVEMTMLITSLAATGQKCTQNDENGAKLLIILYLYIATSLGVTLGLLIKWYVYRATLFRFCVQFSTILGAIAMFNLFNTKCHEENKFLYIVILTLSSINFLTVMLPFMLLMTLICCFPVLLACLPWLGRFFPQEDRPATQDELNLLPSFEYHPDTYDQPGGGIPNSIHQHNDPEIQTSNDETRQCAVCMCEYEEGDVLRRFKCKHDFHQPCIDNWLLMKAICPVCRTPVYKRDDDGNIIDAGGLAVTDEMRDDAMSIDIDNIVNDGESTYQQPTYSTSYQQSDART